MSTDPNIFDCLLDPSEMFVFYQRIGTVLRNDRDIANERVRGQALQNTLLLLQNTAMIQHQGEEYSKHSDCLTIDSFFATLIACIKNTYADEVATIINCNKHYDEVKNQFFIYVNDIPLKYMGLAMLMEQTGEFERIKNKEYFVAIKNYTSRIKKRQLVNLEELQKKLRQDAEHGEQAERFALNYEIARLKQLGINKEPLVISSFDVMAGYDMVSFESELSEKYDRFIEVKSVSSDLEFFWSANEYMVAKEKEGKYFLYLVELGKIRESSYSPTIISDPANSIMSSGDWLVEPQNYRIRKL